MKKTADLINKLSTAPIYTMLILLTVVSFVLNLLLEVLGRHSLIGAFSYMWSHPILFLYNLLIILFVLSLSLLFRRRLTALLFLSTGWIALGVTNFIVLLFRASPLSAIDFLIVKSALSMFSVYLTSTQIIVIIILAVAFVAAMTLLYIKSPKCRMSYKKSIACITVIGLSVYGATVFATDTHALDYDSCEIADAYGSYGFAYCFARSLISHGVERPDDYNPDALKNLKESLETESETETDSTDEKIHPNIIYVQLESFFDVNHIKWLECSEDPTPTFNSLKCDGVSGFLSMANVGGGTANSEFEVLTGMNLDHFGFGEYPYTTVLKSRACESMAANLKRLGYSTHAIHNHTAVFYNRNLAYTNLGFDTFTPVEMMTDITYNPLGWECDDVMTGEIISALDSTDGADFVFGVTVQGHGKYPSEPLDEDEFEDNSYLTDPGIGDELIKVSGIEDPSELAQYTYYVNQLRKTDNFIAELLKALTERGEPCVVVFYGDHMPALSLSKDDIDNGNLYQTEYAIWTNTDLIDNSVSDIGGEDANSLDLDLEAYMLSAYVQKLCGYSEGDITTLHQKELATGDVYDNELRMLEYEQLYDDKAPVMYKASQMTFGTRPITVTGWQMSGNTLYITGSGFNKYSVVKLGGFARTTILINENTLMVENVFFNDGIPEVVQTSQDGTELYRAVIAQEPS